ncbi:MAG: cytochrome C55X precursor NirC [Gammaproteobacteria bacterium]|nr:MAG: cytochrome C55X precursor NirC [Gammaproteobacteria bacterium]
MTLFRQLCKNVQILSLVIFILSVITSAALAAPQSDISPVRKNELTHIVKQDCGSCHGMTLKGGLGSPILPADLTGKSVNFLTFTILEGRQNTAMPPWKAIVSKTEAKWIAQQLKKGAFK